MDILAKIKTLAFRRQVDFSEKARHEMDMDDIDRDEVVESLLNADRIDKILVSRSALRHARREKLYVIKSQTRAGRLLHTKGTIRRKEDTEAFYILVSAKLAT